MHTAAATLERGRERGVVGEQRPAESARGGPAAETALLRNLGQTLFVSVLQCCVLCVVVWRECGVYILRCRAFRASTRGAHSADREAQAEREAALRNGSTPPAARHSGHARAAHAPFPPCPAQRVVRTPSLRLLRYCSCIHPPPPVVVAAPFRVTAAASHDGPGGPTLAVATAAIAPTLRAVRNRRRAAALCAERVRYRCCCGELRVGGRGEQSAAGRNHQTQYHHNKHISAFPGAGSDAMSDTTTTAQQQSRVTYEQIARTSPLSLRPLFSCCQIV